MVCKTIFMSKNNYPESRKATVIVKCPHCNHTGSSRGLFTHVRLSHPGITEKPKTSTRIAVHPYDVKGLGHVKDTIHRIEKKSIKQSEYDWLIKIAAGVVERIMVNNGMILQSKFEKPIHRGIGKVESNKK